MNAVEQIMFLMLLRSPTFIARQRSKVEIKKSFNKERITFLSTFPGKNSNGRTPRNALPNMVHVHFNVIAVKAEWRVF